MPACKVTKIDGQRCKARAQTGSAFCFFHDPDSRERRLAAQSQGGSKPAPFQVTSNPPDFDLEDPSDIAKLVSYAVNRLLRGELDAKAAHTVGYLADCALRVHSAGALSNRVERLERLQNAEQSRPPTDQFGNEFQFEDRGDSVA